jgi:hypothetical protein
MGPNGPLSHGSAIPSIEHLTKYLVKLLHKAQTEKYKVWNAKCRSWMKGGE